MTRQTTFRVLMATAALMAASSLSLSANAQTGAIAIGTGVFPESIASTPTGDLLIGSITQGTVYRAAAGSTGAEPWIKGIGPAVTGVFVNGGRVYVCSNGPFGSQKPALKVFDLATAKETGSFDFPGGGFCSDIAVAPDGTVYVTHLNSTGPGRVLRLTPTGLEVVLADQAIAGIDGIAFLGTTMIANDLRTGDLYRIDPKQPATFTRLKLSEPLKGPDGMRTSEDGKSLLIVEQNGKRLVSVSIDGDSAKVTEIAKDLNGGPTGVAQIGRKAYVAEGHFDALQANTDPGPFVVRLIALP